jgi:hypothetical protein
MFKQNRAENQKLLNDLYITGLSALKELELSSEAVAIKAQLPNLNQSLAQAYQYGEKAKLEIEIGNIQDTLDFVKNGPFNSMKKFAKMSGMLDSMNQILNKASESRSNDTTFFEEQALSLRTAIETAEKSGDMAKINFCISSATALLSLIEKRFSLAVCAIVEETKRIAEFKAATNALESAKSLARELSAQITTSMLTISPSDQHTFSLNLSWLDMELAKANTVKEVQSVQSRLEAVKVSVSNLASLEVERTTETAKYNAFAEKQARDLKEYTLLREIKIAAKEAATSAKDAAKSAAAATTSAQTAVDVATKVAESAPISKDDPTKRAAKLNEAVDLAKAKEKLDGIHRSTLGYNALNLFALTKEIQKLNAEVVPPAKNLPEVK